MKQWLQARQTEHDRVAALLSAYVDDRVNDGERALVDRHLQTCAACRNDLSTLRATVRVLRAAPTQRVPRSFILPRAMARQPRPAWTFPIFRAATVAVAALLMIVVIGDVAGLGAMQTGYLPAGEAQSELVVASVITPEVAPAPLAWTGPATAESPAPGGEAVPAAPLKAMTDATAPTLVPGEAAPLMGKMAEASPTLQSGEDQVEPTAIAAVALASTPPAPASSGRAADSETTVAPTASPLLLRALEFGLAGLALLFGALALVTSGRIRR